ncbi:MAG TPA: hypothetical protein ENN34_01370 [Deltaproteobacteria bacterium]|nr:hypothetical protein [Deltaproteobacteria bacterium]
MEKDVVYYFKCETCHSEIYWSDIRPSVERAARVFKWVRAGCPNEDCTSHITLSDPLRVCSREEALAEYNEKKGKGREDVYWV